MRKIISILIVILIFGCDDRNDEVKSFHFSIKNSSDKNVTIYCYKSYLPNEVQKTITISAGQTFNEVIETNESDSPGFSDFLKGDSIVINYENLSKEIYSCIQSDVNNGCAESRNILLQYDRLKLDDNNILNSYELTQTDYDNAND